MDNQFDNSALKEQLAVALERIERLPYAHYLTEERVMEYLKNIQSNDENPIWHVNRLLGFGSSEIGTLVADVRNANREPGDDYISTFKSARQVVGEKLMYSIPETNEVMQRGKRFEPFIADAFIEQLREAGHKVERDTETLEALKESDGKHSEYPWLRGKNVDDVLLIDGKRILVDYKSPSQEALPAVMHDEGGLTYQAQLNQYDLYAKDKGIKFEGFALACLDLYTADVKPVFLKPNYELQREIIDAGEMFWNDYVMRGRLPAITTQYDYVYDAESIPDDVYEKAAQYVSLKTLQNHVTELAQSAKKEMEDMFRRNKVKGSVAFELGGVTATSKQVLELNEEALIEEAERLGLDLKKFERNGKTSFKTLYNKIEKMAEKDDSIYLDQLMSLEQRGSVRQAGPSKAGHQLYEAVSNDALKAITPVVKSLTASQMEVLDIIKDQGIEQAKKIQTFQNIKTELQESSPLDLSVEDVLVESSSTGQQQEQKEQQASVEQPASTRAQSKAPEPEANTAADATPEPEKSNGQSIDDLDDDFVVEFGEDEIDDIRPSMSR